MDKKFSQIVYGKNCEYVTNLVKNEVSKIEEILSCDFYGSDVEKINNAHGKWVKVNDITIKVQQKLIGILYYVDKAIYYNQYCFYFYRIIKKINIKFIKSFILIFIH